jgi:outer membrane immunogenic protein
MTKRITSLFALTTLVLAVSGSAFAADIGVKAPPLAPAPVYSWTGFYVGGNLGASFGHVKTDFNAAPVTVTTSGGTFTTPGFGASDTVYPSGFMGGGQIGYNWQFSPIWVAGLDADFQGADEKDSATLTNSFNFSAPLGGTSFPVTGAAVTNYSAQIDWFGTVRLRAGYVWGNGNVFSYVTGGLAYGEVKTNGTSIVSGSVGVPVTSANSFSIAHAIGHSNVNTGWTVGYGTEARIDFWGLRNWTWKVEALYIDLGTLDDSDVAIPPPHVASVTGGQVTTHTHFTDGILRAGLNYQFH